MIPIAKRIPPVHKLHGDIREDDYYWLNDKTNPDVIAYLEEENHYFKEVMTPLEGLTEEIYEAMVERVPASKWEFLFKLVRTIITYVKKRNYNTRFMLAKWHPLEMI